jgi:hypothetical protein
MMYIVYGYTICNPTNLMNPVKLRLAFGFATMLFVLSSCRTSETVRAVETETESETISETVSEIVTEIRSSIQSGTRSEWVSNYNYSGMNVSTITAHVAAELYLFDYISGYLTGKTEMSPLVRIDSVRVNDLLKTISIYFNTRYAEYPIRPETVWMAESTVKSYLINTNLEEYTINMYSMGFEIKELIPNYYRKGHNQTISVTGLPMDMSNNHVDPKDLKPDYQRKAIVFDYSRKPDVDPTTDKLWIRNLDQPWSATSGLSNRHIAMWHSHGWYYNNVQKRWKWQRPRLFNTVEDMLPMSFVLPYIVPMLEAAGAYVWIPRERDTQSNEVVVDNDTHMQPIQETAVKVIGSIYSEVSATTQKRWRTSTDRGFLPPSGPIKGNENPFQSGTYRVNVTDTIETASVKWVPQIPETGRYAVYISYQSTESSTTDAHYRVYHAGGETNFHVNQQIGGGTWLYLGHFDFHEGRDESKAAIRLTNKSETYGKVITADAVRFGGGMGIVEREGRTSGRPRFTEAARYNLQYSGIPDTLVWLLNNNNDYNDDFQSRGEWVNYLRGTPNGPNKDRSAGLGIPVDVSLAFHTDAGVTRDDRTIGTLSIYSLPDMNDNLHFPDGMSRMANRDLTDIMQSQIVDDIRARFDTTWVRRRLQNSKYSEAARPNVPSTLLELLSHQNFRDMEFALDPRYRFEVSRSIYKSILKFLSAQYDFDYVVQPLPVTQIRSEFTGNGVRISWKGVLDELEPTAIPKKYVLYTRVEDGGFDNGYLVNDTTVVIQNLKPGVIYSFKVRAWNEGGVSFPSEIISVSDLRRNLVQYQDDSIRIIYGVSGSVEANPRVVPAKTVLIVNGFTRVSAPGVIKEGDFRGFASFMDAGVPDKYDIGFVGEQVNFNVKEDWIENDNPGHGMSNGDFETVVLPGNTFDFAFVHGKAIRDAEYGFVTVSESAVEAGLVSAANYRLVNLILGSQRQVQSQTTFADDLIGMRFGIYGPGVRTLLASVAGNGGGIFVSGAHVGTDLVNRPSPDEAVVLFARDVLKYAFSANHASRIGSVFDVGTGFGYTSVSSTRGRGADFDDSSNDTLQNTSEYHQPLSGTGRSGFTTNISDLNSGDLRFNTSYHPSIYRVDAPDAIKPFGTGAQTILRYRENEFSAAIGYRGPYRSIIMGFPFETITSSTERANLMKFILQYIER